MALDVEHGSFIKQSGTGNQTITMSGSFTPKFIMFFGDGYHTADGIVNDYYGPFRGYTSTTESLSFSTSVETNNKNGQAGLHDGCILILDENAATEGEADIVSMSSGQFVINWTTNANTTACRIFYIAVGGTDLSDIKIGAGALSTSTGNQSFTSITSFTPKIGFFASVHGITTFPTSSVGNSGISYGVAVSSTKRHCIGHPTKGDRGRGVFDDTKIIVNGTSDATLDTEVDFVSFNSDGFTVNIVDAPPAAHQLGYVLLGGASLEVDAGTLTSPATTTTQATTTTSQPSVVGLMTMLSLVGDVWGDVNVQGSFGSGVSATARSNHTYTNPDNKAPESANDDAFVIQGYIAAATLTASTEDADIDSFNATDFTLDWTKVSTSAYEYGWWILGQGAAANVTEPVPNGSLTLTGIAPLTSITGNVKETIPNGTLSLTGIAPATDITPGATELIPNGLLTLTPFAPLDSITGHVRESIPSSNLTLLSNAPLDYITGNVRESVPNHTLTLISFAPNAYILAENITELIPAGTLTLNSFTPATDIVPGATEQIPAGSLTLTGLAPNDYITGDVLESVPSHTLRLTSFPPLAYQPTENTTELIPSSNLVLTSFAPLAAVATTNVTETIPAGSLTLVGFAPSDYQTGHVRESIPVAGLFLNGFAPTAQVPTDNTVEPVPGSNLVLLSTAPAVSVVGNVTEQIPSNVIQLSAYVPTIRNTGAVVTVTERPTGGISKRVKQRKPRQIMVDGKMYTIENPHQELFILQAFLDKLERQFTLDIQKKKVPAVKRKIKLGQSNIARVKTRIKKVETRIEWLRKQDQEILALLAA